MKGAIISSQSEHPFAYMPICTNRGKYCSYGNCRHCFDIDIFDGKNHVKSNFSCKCGYRYCNTTCYQLDMDINHHYMICKSNDSHVNQFIKWTDSVSTRYNSSLYLFSLVVLQQIAINSITNKTSAETEFGEFERCFQLTKDNENNDNNDNITSIKRRKKDNDIDTELEESYVFISIILDRSTSWRSFEFNVSIDRFRQLLSSIEYHQITISIESDIVKFARSILSLSTYEERRGIFDKMKTFVNIDSFVEEHDIMVDEKDLRFLIDKGCLTSSLLSDDENSRLEHERAFCTLWSMASSRVNNQINQFDEYGFGCYGLYKNLSKIKHSW